ncbi:hypothetical protein ONA91_08545 [Micromonospora sp. DR5-3]|uniref:hypothetical protein n=1 Tax=Micromonospora sp. DR5-3 TaxID=2992129 RepID=UPI00222E7951|nr:hypothetical protein [Micromonospora sp. DR5-3]MCW3814505.1 hypothetical protein [Micromonospora sp. DR5-3]
MPFVAFAPSLWAATLRSLRELTRVAATTLALVVGLTGPAAAAAASDPVRPDATHRPVASLSALVAPVDGPAPDALVGAAPVATGAWTADRRPAAAPHSPAGHLIAAATPPAPGLAAALVRGAVALSRTDVAVAAADPDREPIARRGPPRA